MPPADRRSTTAGIHCRCAWCAGRRARTAMVSAFARVPCRRAPTARPEHSRHPGCLTPIWRVRMEPSPASSSGPHWIAQPRICRSWRAPSGDDRSRDGASRTHECAHRQTALPGRPMHHCRVADRERRPQAICRQRTRELGRRIFGGRPGNLDSGRSADSSRREIERLGGPPAGRRSTVGCRLVPLRGSRS
jgi:hypothetical protein